MQTFLDIFFTDIIELKAKAHPEDDNIVLAGSNALREHGLYTDWEPQDLDIILFDPTPSQLLEITTKYEQCMGYETEKKLGDDVLPRSYKLSKEGKELNVIIAYSEPVPNNLLYYNFQGVFFKVNSISNIIEAKKSYASGRDKSFLRKKDILHLMSLKNLNFNI